MTVKNASMFIFSISILRENETKMHVEISHDYRAMFDENVISLFLSFIEI